MGIDTTTLDKTRIIRTRENNPCATLQQIGDKFDCSREWIRQVLNEANQPTKAVRVIHEVYCLNCGNPTTRPKFCSWECYTAYSKVQVPCNYCGQLNDYYAHRIAWLNHRGRQQYFFCDKQCQGKWLAEHHGFIAHPENSACFKRKWDYSKVYDLRDSTGWGAVRIGRALEIPQQTISDILRRRDNKVTRGKAK